MLLLCLAGCDILFPEDAPFEDCRITRLDGPWNTSFVETEGSCGPMPDVQESFEPGRALPAGCELLDESLSADMCTWMRDYECPLPNFPAGIQHWVISETMVDYQRIEGVASAAISDGVHTCQSNYVIVRRRVLDGASATRSRGREPATVRVPAIAERQSLP